MNRRRFLSLAGTSIAGVALVGCGSKEANPEVVVTKIPNVAGAPPTLAPNATPPNTSAAPSGGASPAAGGGAATFTLEAHDPYDWSVKKFTIEQGGTVTVINKGVLPHDFSVDALKISQPLDPGKTYEIKIPADAKPGDYEYYCNVPSHKAAGMFGTMTVVAKGASGQPQQGAAAPAAAPSTNVEVEMGDLFFKPKEFSIPADTEATVTLKNTGALPHDFNIDKLNVHSPVIQPSTTGTVKIKAPAGTYQYYCNELGHKAAGMVGTLTVVAKGSGAAAQAPAGKAPASPAASAQASPVQAAPQASPAEATPQASPVPATPAASPVASPVQGGPGGQTAAAIGSSNITIEMVDFAYKPNKFQIPANTEVTITLKNDGALPHDFNIDDLKIHSEVVQPGKTGTVKLKGPKGTYQYYCNEPGHKTAGMVGTLTII